MIKERATELLEFFQLAERAKDKVDPLSGGMKRRLAVARGLINEPELLLLDEPTTGLDPQARHLLWERLYQLKRQGVTIVLTTHYMDEAEQLCDRLVIVDNGTIAAEGSPRELIRRYSTREVVELRFFDPADQQTTPSNGSTAARTASNGSPIASCSTPPTATPPSTRSTQPRREHRVGLRPPQHPRRRLPHAHRPGPRMTAIARVGRLVERELCIMRRLWHGDRLQRVRRAVAVPLRHGRRGRRLRRRSLTATRSVGSPTCSSSRPVCSPPTSCMLAVGDSLWWVMGGTKWDKRYHAMIAGPIGTTDVLAEPPRVRSAARRGNDHRVPDRRHPARRDRARGGRLLSPLVAMLFVVAVAAPVSAWSTFTESDRSFGVIMRVGVMPLLLFSGTFFPTASLPAWGRALVPLSPLYHGVELLRAATTGRSPGTAALAGHVAVLAALLRRRVAARRAEPSPGG